MDHDSYLEMSLKRSVAMTTAHSVSRSVECLRTSCGVFMWDFQLSAWAVSVYEMGLVNTPYYIYLDPNGILLSFG